MPEIHTYTPCVEYSPYQSNMFSNVIMCLTTSCVSDAATFFVRIQSSTKTFVRSALLRSLLRKTLVLPAHHGKLILSTQSWPILLSIFIRISVLQNRFCSTVHQHSNPKSLVLMRSMLVRLFSPPLVDVRVVTACTTAGLGGRWLPVYSHRNVVPWRHIFSVPSILRLSLLRHASLVRRWTRNPPLQGGQSFPPLRW